MKKIVKAILAVVLVVVVAAVGALLFVFRGEIKTVVGVEPDAQTGIYSIDYAADYKLDNCLPRAA